MSASSDSAPSPASPLSLRIEHGRLPVTFGALLDFPADPIACMRKLHARHGDLAVLEEDGRRIAFVFSPELNRQVLGDSRRFHSQFFSIRGGKRSAQRRVTSGLLSQNGTEHRDSRRLMMEVFSRQFIPQYHTTICELTDELTGSWSVGSIRDLNAEMVRFMLRLTSALLFGIDDADFSMQLGAMIDRWVRENHRVGLGALVSSSEFTESYQSLLQLAEELERDVLTMFEMHRARQSSRTNILQLLFRAQESDHGLSDKELIGHTTLLFAAAHLTTAHTLSWTLFLLAQHPEVLAAVSSELNEVMQGDIPTFEEAQRLDVLDRVIRESMRVLPASSYSQRITSEPVQLGRLHLPRHTPVIFSQYMTHHREDLFPDADVFRPDRWLTIRPSAYEYLPFGAGPRMCIGAQLAMAEMRTSLAIMLKRYHMQMLAGSEVSGRVISTMLGPTSTVEARLIPSGQLPRTAPVFGSIHDLVELPESARARRERRAA